MRCCRTSTVGLWAGDGWQGNGMRITESGISSVLTYPKTSPCPLAAWGSSYSATHNQLELPGACICC